MIVRWMCGKQVVKKRDGSVQKQTQLLAVLTAWLRYHTVINITDTDTTYINTDKTSNKITDKHNAIPLSIPE
jgi:hypothetical protein